MPSLQAWQRKVAADGVEPMKINYIGHDEVYRHKRAAREIGWDTPHVLRRSIEELEAFLAEAAFPEHPSMLELGCGAGDVALHFARKGWKVAGIDISPFAVEWAREKAEAEGTGAKFIVADVTRKIDKPMEPADLVLDGHCLHCIVGRDRAVFFENALAHMKTQGLLCIDSMCGEPVSSELRRHFDAENRCVVHDGIAGRYLGLPEEILGEVEATGLEIVKHSVQTARDTDDQDSLRVLARRAAPLRCSR